MKIRADFVNKLNQINFKNACRICITGKNCLREIHRTRIPKMMETCALVRISEGDGLPHKICVTCFRTITKLYTFKKKIERNDKILRDFIENKNTENEHKNIINMALEDADISQITEDKDKYLYPNVMNEVSLSASNALNQCKLEEKFQILPDTLPPLVPIAPYEKLDTVDNLSRDLPQDAPPLVPIKPLVDMKTLVDVVPELEYKCYICNNKFTDISILKKHTLTTCKPKDLQCTVCLKEFNERKKLIGHLKGHMVVKDHMCKICGKKYPNPSTFRIHMRSHTGERPFKCQICNKGFVRWAGVRLHMKTHEDRRPFSCNMCQKSFKVSSNLERHKRTHYGIEPYSCSYCHKSYSQLENLNMHIRTYHTKERPFLCNICGKGFVNSTRLNRHMWIHSGCKPYKCRICSKAYSNNTDLRIHETYHLGKNVNELKNYSCDKCNMKFFHPCRLTKHKKVHDKYNRCEVCDKTFRNKEMYKTHLSAEHGFDVCVDETFSVEFHEIVEPKNKEEVFFSE